MASGHWDQPKAGKTCHLMVELGYPVPRFPLSLSCPTLLALVELWLVSGTCLLMAETSS